MSTDMDMIYGSWATWILIPISIIISLTIIKKELRNRKQTQDQQKLVQQDSYQKWLNISSLTAMILFTMQLIINLINKIPVICQYSYVIIVTFWCLAHCTLALYQTIRLQAIFSSERIHSTFGYSIYTFYIIYGVIFISMVYAIYAQAVSYDYDDYGVYGCGIIFASSDTFENTVPISILLLFTLHCGVLMLYVIKICQISKQSSVQDERVMERIKFFLRKIILLTLLYFLSAVFMVVLVSFIIFIDFYDTILGLMVIIGNILFTIYLVYLMLEHNNKDYIKFINKCKIFKCILCCCRNQEIQSETGRVTISSRTDLETDTVRVNSEEMEKETKEISLNTMTHKPPLPILHQQESAPSVIPHDTEYV